jgi:hypothetical protein
MQKKMKKIERKRRRTSTITEFSSEMSVTLTPTAGAPKQVEWLGTQAGTRVETGKYRGSMYDARLGVS